MPRTNPIAERSSSVQAVERRSVIGACPLDCPDGCSWIVEVEDGRAVDLRANSSHPFTGKSLCVKTNPYLHYSAHPDRLLYPQRRVGAKGGGHFERISWDQALGEISERLQAASLEHGAESIWPYFGTGSVGWVQGIVGAGRRLFHALGASRHDPNICSAAGHAGIRYTTGSAAGMDPEDLVHSGLILLWGTNTIVTNRHLWPFIKQAQKNGAKVVTIDPLRTLTAKHADLHIPLRPGSDAVLALGLMRYLAEEGAVDDEYLAHRTLGWEEFRQQELAEFTPQRVAELCDIEEDSFLALGRWAASRRPLAIRSLMGMQRHRGGGQAARVLSCVPAITGDYQRLGGGFCYTTGPCYQLNVDALCRPDLQPDSTRTLTMTRLGQGLLELDDPPVAALIVVAANPMASNPEQARIRRGLAREDLFTVVIENFQTDTADYADILLPGTMQTEHADLHDSFSHLYLQWNEPAVAAPGECLSHTEIFRRLARRLGLDEPALQASDEQLARAALASKHPALEGVTLEKLKAQGWQRLAWPQPYQPFLEHFFTPSKRFEFRSQRAAAEGHGLYPHYTRPRETAADADDGSLILLSPANQHLLNSMFANSSHHARAGGPTLVLHPADVERLQLRDGQRVRAWNQRGEFFAQLKSSDATRRGVALSSKGQWPKLNGGSSVNATVAERDADMARGGVYSDNRVFVAAG